MAASRAQTIAIIVNVVVFLLTVLFNQLSTKKSAIFPSSTGDISENNPTEITPFASTFVIWALVYLYQASWIVYSLSLLWRGDGRILHTWFYWSYALANVSNICWLIVLARGHFELSLVILVLLGLSLDISLYYALTGLKRYLDLFPNNETLPNRVDVWCVRLLVQNGVIFYNTWVYVSTSWNISLVLQYQLHLSETRAAVGALSALLIVIITWFALENVVFEKHTRFIFAEYIMLIISLGGILRKNWTGGEGSQGFALLLLVFSALLMLSRFVIIIYKERNTANNGFNLKYIVRR